METYSFIIDSSFEDNRIDTFLSSEIDNISRSRIQTLIKNGHINVNNKEISKSYKLNIGDILNVNIPTPEQVEILAEDINIDIVYEDENIIVVNKHQGMVVHPANGHYSKTLVNALMYHCKDTLSGINGIMRPGIVHRIDKDTSGILVVAKNDLSHQKLALQLANHSMNREYYAVVHNNVKKDKGTVNKPIGRHSLDRKKMSITDKNSKEAITHFEVLERYSKYTLIKCILETGRTHQIRVHMASIGNPLLGDVVYGYKNQPFKLNGQTLHAKLLGFLHPVTNDYVEFNTDLPQYFQDILKKVAR